MAESRFIVEPIRAGEPRASVVAKIGAIIDVRLGTDAFRFARTFGDLRQLLNRGTPAQFRIAAGESGASVRRKLNDWFRVIPETDEVTWELEDGRNLEWETEDGEQLIWVE